MINTKRESNSTIELAFMRLLVAVLKTALLIVATVATAQAEPRKSTERNRNYILCVVSKQDSCQASQPAFSFLI